MRASGFMVLVLLCSVGATAQDQGCPEGYIEGPGSTKEQLQCTFVGYGEEDDTYADEIPEGMEIDRPPGRAYDPLSSRIPPWRADWPRKKSSCSPRNSCITRSSRRR